VKSAGAAGTSFGSNSSDVPYSENFLLILWRHAWIIIGMVALALVGGAVYLAKSTPVYTSSSRLYVEQSGPKIINDTEEGVMTGYHNYLYTQAELIRATPIALAALQSPELAGLRTFKNMQNPVEYLKRSLQTSVGNRDGLISVSFTGPYPTEAAQIVNAVIDAYITFHSKRKHSTAMEILKILQKEKNQRSQELSEQLQAVMDFKTQHEDLVFYTEQGNLIVDRLQRLSDALTDAQLAVLESKTLQDTIEKMVSDPLELRKFMYAQQNQAGTTAMPDTEVDRLRVKLNDLIQQRSDRLSKLKTDHPAIKILDSEIGKIQKQIDEHNELYAQALLARAQQQYMAAKDKESELSKQFEEGRQQAVALNQQVDQYTLLTSEWEQTKKLNDVLNDRIKELNVTEDAGVLNIVVLEVARAAAFPSAPDRARVMSIALVIGLMAGGGGALLRDVLDYRIRSGDEVKAIVGAPLLGIIPSMSRRQSISERGQQSTFDSGSQVTEAFRTIRTAVFFSISAEQARILHVTSALPGAGKSTLVSNLGITMAQSGQRVLIIDADLRKPMQHEIFKISRMQGLTDVLSRTGYLRKVVFSTTIEGLDVLPCGPDVGNPAELLGSLLFKKILEKLSKHYDRILVDSPPVIPVTDGSILAAVCDATILVVRAGRTRRNALRRAKESVVGVGGNILGCAVNDVGHRNAGYETYKYGYRYDRRQGGGRNGKKKSGLLKPEVVTRPVAARTADERDLISHEKTI